jgi:hypothetical protein
MPIKAQASECIELLIPVFPFFRNWFFCIYVQQQVYIYVSVKDSSMEYRVETDIKEARVARDFTYRYWY